MPHNLTHDDLEHAFAALTGEYTIDVGPIRLIGASLPGKVVCAILPPLGDGIVRVVHDLDKPNAVAHTRAMLKDWWESYSVPVAFPDGTVELVRQACPREASGQVALSIAG